MSSTGMLGRLPLSKAQRARDALEVLLASADGEQVLEQFHLFIQKKPNWVGERPIKKRKGSGLLVYDGSLSGVAISERFDPKAFYQSSADLYLGEYFQREVLAAAHPIEAGMHSRSVRYFRMTRGTTGNELYEERPKDVSDASILLSFIATKLKAQWKGKEGELRKDRWYVFNTKGASGGVVSVCVDWHSVHGNWHVDADSLGVGWDADACFVSRILPM